MEEIKNTKEFSDFLAEHFNFQKQENKPEKYRYVIYVRKSTDEDGKQNRSIDDQIAECKETAKRENLYVKDIIIEKQSAKEPDIRPKLRKMLDDIKNDVYDGIIAWHPDRLSRNMKEAGEIIDLLDKKDILDLKFSSYTFTNDTSGKMTLGITFVLSKQYSDSLSDNVKRGNKRAILEAKYINTAKHGYIKDKNQRLRPDGNNFVLIQNAFQMRLSGRTLDDISKYLNDNEYTKYKKKTNRHEKFIWNKKKLSELLKDTAYTGVLVYGAKNLIVNFDEYYDFIPIVSVQDFLKINKKLSIKDKKFSIKKMKTAKTKAKLLNGKVFCYECGEKMSTGLTTKKLKSGIKKQYFNYRCNTRDCSRFNKSTRANVIVNFVKSFLDEHPFSNIDSYNHYKEEMKRINSIRIKEKNQKLRNLQSQKRSAERLIENTKRYILENQNEDRELIQSFKNDLKNTENTFKSLSRRVLKLQDEINREKDIILTYDDFLELWSKAVVNIDNIKNIEQLDTTLQKLFSNFYVSKKKVEKTMLSEPFSKLADCNNPKVTNCGR